MREKWPDPWKMAGTEGTNEYLVVVLTELGRLGYRALEDGSFRIRVEPTDLGRAPLSESLTPGLGWKQPGSEGEDRFSLVVSGSRRPDSLDLAIRALDPSRPGTLINQSITEQDRQIVDKAVRQVQEQPKNRPVRRQVFFSYSHKDEKWLKELRIMLKPAIPSDMLWDDKRIVPGQKWKEEIRKSLSSARVAVLLVSQYFLASEFIQNNELPPILQAEREEGLTILWVPVRSCMYKNTPIEQYQALYEPSRPLESLKASKRNSVLVSMCEQIKAALDATPSQSSNIDSDSQLLRATAPEMVGTQHLRMLAYPNVEVDVRVDRQSRSITVTMSNRGAHPLRIGRARIYNTDETNQFSAPLHELSGRLVASGASVRTRHFLNNPAVELDSGALEDWVSIDFDCEDAAGIVKKKYSYCNQLGLRDL